MDTTFDRVKRVAARQLNVDSDKVTPEAHLVNDLGADSFDRIELVMELEEDFDIEISDQVSDRIKTIADAVKVIDELLEA